MERKFTDDEIVKALECICENVLFCADCPYSKTFNQPIRCKEMCAKDALDLINRQKAEIERLNGIRADLSKEIEGLRTATEEAVGCYNRMESLYHIKCMELKVSKSEAIKEFSERVKDIVDEPALIRGRVIDVTIAKIDNLVQEMTGENNGN